VSSLETAPGTPEVTGDALDAEVPESPSPADAPGKRVGMSRVSQSIAASLANREKRVGAHPAIPEDTVRVRPAAQTAPISGLAPELAFPRGPVAPEQTAPHSPLSTSILTALSGSLPTALPGSIPTARSWSPAPEPPTWGQPEIRPVEPPHLLSPDSPLAQVVQQSAPPPPPAVELPSPVVEPERPGRLRRFWEKPSSSSSAPAGPTASESETATLRQASPGSALTAQPLGAPATGPGVPTGHLGTVPQTALTLPVPTEALPPAVPAGPQPVPSGPRPVTPTSIKPPTPPARQSRKARLRLARVDPWSVMKTSLLFGVAGAIIAVVATFIIFTVIDQTGLYDSINRLMTILFSSSDTPFDITTYINTRRAVGVAALIGALDVVIITALATIFAALYNLAANVMGGVEITLGED